MPMVLFVYIVILVRVLVSLHNFPKMEEVFLISRQEIIEKVGLVIEETPLDDIHFILFQA